MRIPPSLALVALFLAAPAQGASSAGCALSPEIRADTDILYITRTYNFTRADEVVTSD